QGAHGLRGDFYNDANNNGVLDFGTDTLVGERTDPAVSFDLGSAIGPVAAQDPSRALAEWTGYLTLPQPAGCAGACTSSWQLGDISSDGLKVTLVGPG